MKVLFFLCLTYLVDLLIVDLFFSGTRAVTKYFESSSSQSSTNANREEHEQEDESDEDVTDEEEENPSGNSGSAVFKANQESQSARAGYRLSRSSGSYSSQG